MRLVPLQRVHCRTGQQLVRLVPLVRVRYQTDRLPVQLVRLQRVRYRMGQRLVRQVRLQVHCQMDRRLVRLAQPVRLELARYRMDPQRAQRLRGLPVHCRTDQQRERDRLVPVLVRLVPVRYRMDRPQVLVRLELEQPGWFSRQPACVTKWISRRCSWLGWRWLGRRWSGWLGSITKRIRRWSSWFGRHRLGAERIIDLRRFGWLDRISRLNRRWFDRCRFLHWWRDRHFLNFRLHYWSRFDFGGWRWRRRWLGGFRGCNWLGRHGVFHGRSWSGRGWFHNLTDGCAFVQRSIMDRCSWALNDCAIARTVAAWAACNRCTRNFATAAGG